VTDIPNAGVAEGSENDGRHSFLCRRQRFRSAAEEKRNGNGDQRPNCRYGKRQPFIHPNGRLSFKKAAAAAFCFAACLGRLATTIVKS
jgi:hypothetical protein